MTPPESEAAPAPSHGGVPHEGPVERACAVLCEIAICVMLVIIGLDIFTRAVFNYSFEISDDVGGYMLVLITFVSLPVCQAHGSFHHVEFLQARLPPRWRAASRLLFDVIALAAALVLAWEMVRLELTSWQSGDVAPTYLATPLWLPQIPMAIGMAALCMALISSISRHARALRSGVAAGPTR